MDIDIPLPGEEAPITDVEPPDIPMPDDPPEPPRKKSPEPTPVYADSTVSEASQEDSVDFSPPLPPDPAPSTDEEDDPNRYSPSVPMEEDDLPMPELPAVIPPLLPPPPPPPSLAPLPPASAPRSPSPSPEPPSSPVQTQARSLVLGKTQAKKRLLAFSMTKQGGGAGVSFNLAKKPIINKESAKGFGGEEKDETKKKPAKKGSVDKARDTISEIEELKRKEMQLLENMSTIHPRWGLRDTLSLPSALPLQLAVGEVLAKKLKRDSEKKEKGRSRSPSDDRRRSKSKRDKERSRRKKKLPTSWHEFKKEGHKVHHFRRFKYEVEKHDLREKKRHKRSRSRK